MAEQLAWQTELDLQCSGCGRPKDEAWSREAEGTYEARVTRCHACAESARTTRKWSHQPGADAGGIYVGVLPTELTPTGGAA